MLMNAVYLKHTGIYYNNYGVVAQFVLFPYVKEI